MDNKLKTLELRLNVLEDDLHDLRIKYLELAGLPIPHEETWYSIPDYCEYAGIDLDAKMLREAEREAKALSEEYGCSVETIPNTTGSVWNAYSEKVLDELFCGDGIEAECQSCPCLGCPHCPSEVDELDTDKCHSDWEE